MTIESDGNVGIGNPNPDTLLELTTNTGYDPELQFSIAATEEFTLGVDYSDGEKFKIGTTACDTNTRLTIDSSGNVGIGTTSPSTTLHVDGDVAFELDDTPLTISDPADAVTVTHSFHIIDASSGTDDLDTINGGNVAGQILIITAASGDTITVKNGEDNIILSTDISMDVNDILTLIYDGTNWLELSYSSNT
jgi:hypothetical protein